MPLPLILGIGAAVAAAGGMRSGIHGAVKMKDANVTMNAAKTKQERAIKRLEKENEVTTTLMDSIAIEELNVLKSFDTFSELIEKIQDRPEFKAYYKNGVEIPEYEAQQLKDASIGAGLLLGGLGGAAAGTAGGFAAAGAVTSAVMAMGTATTGTAIASLSGAALTNATFAAIGGGALAAGGGGIALGTTILGAATAGVGLLVGGIIFNITGSKLSDKAEEAYRQAEKTEEEANAICTYLSKLSTYGDRFQKSLQSMEKLYENHLQILKHIINYEEKTLWSEFSAKDRRVTENTVLIVGMLYNMCKVQLVLKDKNNDNLNEVNVKGIIDIVMAAEQLKEEINTAV